MVAKDRPEPSRDFSASLACAEAFQQLAEPFISKIARDVKEGRHDHPNNDLGDLVACAVNLAFALELYMKTLLGQLAIPFPRSHDLRELHDLLPEGTRAELNAGYAALMTQWFGRRASVTIAKGPAEAPTWSDYSKVSNDLPSVLERSSNLFQAWRYIWEFTVPDGSRYQFHQFEYGLLVCACNAAKAVTKKSLAESSLES